MNLKTLLGAVGIAALSATTASALTLSSIVAEFDDADDLLRIAGTIGSVTANTRNDFVFDFDGAAADYDWTMASPVSSLPNGTYFEGRSIRIAEGFGYADVAGAPISAGLTFDFLVRLTGASASNFVGADIDFFICNDCVSFIGSEDVDNAVTVSAADLTAAPVPLPAGGVLILSGLVGFAALRRRKAQTA